METQWLDQSSYKEDCEWAAVALAFPHLFTGYERRCADEMIRNWQPEAWEAINGRPLAAGESFRKDQCTFERKHVDDWIVISAMRSDHRPGMTEVIATMGGTRDHRAEERRFLVPSGEYAPGRFGFVIDPDRHAAYDGPSSFATWNR